MTNADLVYYNGPWAKTPRDVVARQAFIKRTKDGTPNIGNSVIRLPIHSYNPPSIGRLPPSGYATSSITHKSLAYGTRRKPQTGRKSLQRLKSKVRPEDQPTEDRDDFIERYNADIRAKVDMKMENVEVAATPEPLPIIKTRPLKFGIFDADGDNSMTGSSDKNKYQLRIVTNPDKNKIVEHGLGDMAEHNANHSGSQKSGGGSNELITQLDNLGGHLPGHPRTAKEKNEIAGGLSATASSSAAKIENSYATYASITNPAEDVLKRVGVIDRQISEYMKEKDNLKKIGKRTKQSINRSNFIDKDLTKLLGQKKAYIKRMNSK